jgi:hypothetical protein
MFKGLCLVFVLLWASVRPDQPAKSVPPAESLEQFQQPRHAEPHDCEEVPIYALDDCRTETLDAVGTRLVHRLTSRNVFLALLRIKRAEPHSCGFHSALHPARHRQRDSCVDDVLIALEPTKHLDRFFHLRGLTKYPTTMRDKRVATDRQRTRLDSRFRFETG